MAHADYELIGTLRGTPAVVGLADNDRPILKAIWLLSDIGKRISMFDKERN